MNNRFIATVLKIAGVCFAVLSGILVVRVLSVILFGAGASVTVTAVITALFYAVVGFVALCLYWGIANVLDDIDDLREINYRIMNQNKKILEALDVKDASGYNLSEIAASTEKTGDGKWICPACGQTNPHSQRMCKDCGHQM